MGRRVVDRDLLLKVAYQFYEEGRSNKEIAAAFKIDEVQVSRLVRRAAREHLVRISTRISFNQNLELELLRQFRNGPFLTDVHIASPISEDPEIVSRSVYTLAAEKLEDLIKKDFIVGLTCGRAVIGTINRMFPAKLANRGIQFVPFNNFYYSPGEDHSGKIQMIDSSAIALLAFAKFGAESTSRPTDKETSAYMFPVIQGATNEAAGRELYERNPTVRKLVEMAAAANIVLCGIGSYQGARTPANVSALLRATGISSKDVEKLGWIGEINLEPFDEEGRPSRHEETDFLRGSPELAKKVRNYFSRFYSIPLTTLRSIACNQDRRVFAVAFGKHKAHAILAAIRGQLINILVTDEVTGEELLKLARQTDQQTGVQ